MRAIQAIVRGRVQGVFFRAYTRDEAQKLRVSGWVRNRRDGSVECFAQGSEAAIEQFIEFLHQGPPHSRVDTVEVHNVSPDPNQHDFHITY